VADPAGAESELPSEYQQAVYKLVRSTYISIYIKYMYIYTLYIHIYAEEARRRFDAFVADPAGAESELPSEYQQAVYKLVRTIYLSIYYISMYGEAPIRRVRRRSGWGRKRASIRVPASCL